MANGQEKEIKLVSTPAGRKKLLQLPLVKEKLIAGSRHELALVNRYYDTRDQKLTRTGMAYRIRRTNGKAFEATVKTRGETVNGFSARQEYTVQLEKERNWKTWWGFAQMDEREKADPFDGRRAAAVIYRGVYPKSGAASADQEYGGRSGGGYGQHPGWGQYGTH